MDGVRVLEVGIYAFAPAAGAVLADWGADVVKVEHPEAGDPLRGLVAYGVKPGEGGVTYLWEVLNRGKRSVGIDIATDDGRELLLSLCEGADVFLTNFLAPACHRLGIDADSVRARNPRIIYARGTGHGPKGPDADKGGYDGVSFWARSGREHRRHAARRQVSGRAAGPGLRRHPERRPPGRRHRRRPVPAGADRARGRWSTCRCSGPGCGPCSRPSPGPMRRARSSSTRSTGAGRPTRCGTCTARPTAASSRCRCWRATGTGRASALPPAGRSSPPTSASPTPPPGWPTSRRASSSSTPSSPSIRWRSGSASSAPRTGPGR